MLADLHLVSIKRDVLPQLYVLRTRGLVEGTPVLHLLMSNEVKPVDLQLKILFLNSL